MSTPAIMSALQSFGGSLISYKDAGLPQKLQNQNYKQLGPRLGFAYKALEGKKAFVVRGGYRMSYYAQKLQDWVGAQSGSIPVAANFQNTVSNTALSPDGLPNYGLRSIPRYQAGVNTPDSIIDVNDTRLLARGFNVGVLSPDHTEGRVQDWNLTLEKEIFSNTVLRVGYVGNYGDNQQQEIHYNDETPEYIWYATRRAPLPTGPFASVATRPYDQQAYGDITLYSPTGYARYNGWKWSCSSASAAVSRIRFSGTSGTHYSSTRTPTIRKVSKRCPARTCSCLAPFPRTRSNGTAS